MAGLFKSPVLPKIFLVALHSAIRCMPPALLQDAYLVRAQTKALDAHPKERGWVRARPDHKAPYCCKQGSFELIALAWLKKKIVDKEDSYL